MPFVWLFSRVLFVPVTAIVASIVARPFTFYLGVVLLNSPLIIVFVEDALHARPSLALDQTSSLASHFEVGSGTLKIHF